jgi:hypothetical protein
MRIRLLFAMLAIASMVRPGRAGAQVTDVIRGRVTSGAGATAARGGGAAADTTGLQGVHVKATSYAGGVTKTATTDKTGRFTIMFINGEGDYWIEFTRIGFAPQRREIKRIGEEEVLIVNTRMLTAIATLDSVRVNATRPGVRALPNRNAADPDVSGATKALTNADVAADQLGNLAAMAALIAGIQMIPGLDGAADMYSVLGLTGDQNNTTFNGVGSGISVLPPDIIATTSIQQYSFDPSIGGFSGGQIAIRTSSGSNFSRRALANGNILPPLEWADRTADAQAQKYTNVRVGGNAAGALVMDKAFYNTAYNFSRRFNDSRTLLNTNAFGLAAAGVASDSVTRLRDILRDQRIPASAGGIPSDQIQNAIQGSANFDLTPSSSGTGSSFTIGLLGNYQQSDPVGQGGLLLATPSHAGTSTRWAANAGIVHTNYLNPFGIGVLSKTTLGVASSRGDVTPYLLLPEGSVRVRSDLDDSTSTVKSLFFGGSSVRSENVNNAVQLKNQLSWYSASNKHTFKLATSIGHSSFSTNNGAGTLGSFAFNSLADLEAGHAASFTRTLSDRRQSTSQVTASASLGDYWRPAFAVQVQYGVRVDANRFLSVPEFNQDVLAAFGRRNDHTPNDVYVSPRLGLQWTYGKPPTVAYAPGAARPPAAVVHAGAGVFQNVGGPQLIGGALGATGLASSTQSMACVGDAVPVPDWSAFLTNPDLIPTECTDGSAGTVFSTSSPSVTLFDSRYRQARSLRAAADWSGPILDNRFVLGVQGILSHGLNQSGMVDINVDTTTRFALANESGRPVFADPGAIVGATGVIAPADGRVSDAFQRVWLQQSGLRLNSRLLSINLKPVTASRWLKWDLTYTLLDANQTFYGFTSTVGNPFDIGRGPSLQSGRHTVSLFWRSLPVFDFVYVTAGLRMQSGTPYTPRIAGDVNGDGVSNDRAYITNPATSSDATAAGIQSLLDDGAPSVRACLARQLGQFAERGSCQSPWTATALLQFRFNPSKIGLPKRSTVSLTLQNPFALADLALHGGNSVRGWGRATQPDQTLLFVRGFDPVTQQFRYDVNQRFGSTRPQQSIGGAVPYLSISVNLDIGAPRERQVLEQRLDAGRGRPGTKTADLSIWQLGVASIPNPMSMVVQQADSLRLTRVQADSLAWLSHLFAVFADSVWTPASRELAAVPDNYDHGDAYRRYVRARERTVDYLLTLIPDAKSVLTAKQRRRLPLQIANFFDERVLRFLRSSSSGDGSAVGR